MRRTLSIKDRLERWFYLQRVELRLDSLPGKRRKAIIAELKSNVEDAAHVLGMRAAIDELGSPRVLAKQYLEAEPKHRPHWNMGSLVTGVLLYAWVVAQLLFTLGIAAALADTGHHGMAHGSFLGSDFEVKRLPGGMSVLFLTVPWTAMIVLSVVFLLASRAWNVLPVFRNRERPSPQAMSS